MMAISTGLSNSWRRVAGRGARPDVREEFPDGAPEMTDEAAALNGAGMVLREPRADADPADAISEIAKPYFLGCLVWDGPFDFRRREFSYEHATDLLRRF
jgi:hypothetical protein